MERMKQNNAINFLLLFLCILLLGFVYLNSKVIDQFYVEKNKASYNQTMQQNDLNDGIKK
jgi:Na+-transporting methylmalonyl-CoA/oxaloacetate decarboxylase gamma subunit